MADPILIIPRDLPPATEVFASDALVVDADTIIALSSAARAHVSACFALERDIAAQIEAETITSREQVEAAYG